MRGCYVQCSVLAHKKTKFGNKEGLLGYHWSNRENTGEVVGPEFDLVKRSIWKGRRTGRAGSRTDQRHKRNMADSWRKPREGLGPLESMGRKEMKLSMYREVELWRTQHKRSADIHCSFKAEE